MFHLRRLCAVAIVTLGLAAAAPLAAAVVSLAPDARPVDAPKGPPPMLTDLSADHLGAAVSPGPTRESQQIDLARWAIDGGALAQSYDPKTDTNWVLMPAGARAVVPARIGLERARVRHTAHTKADYDRAERSVITLARSGQGAKYSFAMHIDAATGRLEVLTDAPTATTARLDSVAADVVRFRSGEVEQQAGTRGADTSPHYGGAWLARGPGGTCSLGPTATVWGIPVGLTAGHCGHVGMRLWTGTGALLGSIDFVGNDYMIDIARVSGGGWYGPYIYFGGRNTPYVLRQVGSGDPAPGILVWTSAGNSASTAGYVTHTSSSMCIQGQCWVGMFSTDNSLTVNGDSGGAVHTESNGKAGVRGVHVGLATSGQSFVTRWSMIAWLLGATIIT